MTPNNHIKPKNRFTTTNASDLYLIIRIIF